MGAAGRQGRVGSVENHRRRVDRSRLIERILWRESTIQTSARSSCWRNWRATPPLNRGGGARTTTRVRATAKV
jgi:hypothetical protein